MASIGKTVEMALKITAIADLAGLGQLKTGLAGIMKHAGKIAGMGAAIALGWKGVEGVGKFLSGMKTQADAAQKSSERLRQAIGRSKEGMKATGEGIEKMTNRLRDLARDTEKEGLLAAQAMETGFAKLLSAGFGSKQIEKSAKGLEGMVIALRGVGATADDVGDVTQKIRNFVEGTALLPKEFNSIMTASDKAKNSFKVLTSQAARGEFVMGLFAKNAWRTGAALETQEGQARKTIQVWEALQRTLGEPFVETQKAFNEVMGEIGKALEPVAKEVAKVLTPAMNDFAKWIRDNKGTIAGLGPIFVEAFKGIMEGAKLVGQAFEAIDLAVARAIIAFDEFSQGEITLPQLAGDIGDIVSDLFKPIREFDWSKLSKDVRDGIAKINWIEAFEAAGSLMGVGFGNAIKFAVAAVGGIGKHIKEGLDTTNWGEVMGGVGKGILGFFKNLGTELGAAIGEAFGGINWMSLIPKEVKGILEFFKIIPKEVKAIEPPLQSVQQEEVKVKKEAENVAAAVSSWDASGFIGQVGTAFDKVRELAAAAANVGSVGAGAALAPVPQTQAGGLFSHPQIRSIAEAGPEAVIPLQRSARSRGLLSTAAEALGMGGRMGGGGGSYNVNVTPNITINGVAAGQEGAVGREVERAMRNPIEQMLEQLRKARDEERRLAYV